MEQFQKAGMPLAISLSTESPGRPKGKGVRPRWCTYPLRCRCRAYRRCNDRSPCASRHLQTQLPGSGLEISSLGVRDIILPGEMKTLLGQVVEAEKAAQANVIRRREETQATRSLLNTAKVMEGSPTALRLKELETLERVAERIDRISVFGGLDQVLNGLVSLKAG